MNGIASSDLEICVDGKTIEQRARKLTGPLEFAVAFWGLGAAEMLGLGPDRKASILCNPFTGCCSVEELRNLQSFCNIRCDPRLHAKMYLGDNGVIVGSANASTDGLGGDGAGWTELGVVLRDAGSIARHRTWFNERFAVAEPLSDGILERAERAVMHLRAARDAAINKSVSLVYVLRHTPELLEGKKLYAGIISDDSGQTDEAKAFFKRVMHDNGFPTRGWDFWELWGNTEVPPDGTVMIDFYRKRRKYDVDTAAVVREIGGTTRHRSEAEGIDIVICKDVKRPFGFRFNSADKAELEDALRRYIPREPDDYVVGVEDLTKILNGQTVRE